MFAQERHREDGAVDHSVFERGGVRAGLHAALNEVARFCQHDGIDQRRFGREASVESGAADPAAAGDVFHGGASDPNEFGLFECGCQDARGGGVGVVDLGENGRSEVWQTV